MKNRIHDVQNAALIFTKDGVNGYKLLQKEDAEFIFLEFEIGSKTDSHFQNVNMYFFIVSGTASLQIDEIPYYLSKGQMVEIEAGKNRQWINTGNEKLVVYVVKILSAGK